MSYRVLGMDRGRFKRLLGDFATQAEAESYADKFSADEGIQTQVIKVMSSSSQPAGAQ